MALTLNYVHHNTGVTSATAYVRIVDVNELRKEIRQTLLNGPAPGLQLDENGTPIQCDWIPECREDTVWTCHVRAGVYDTQAARQEGKAPVSYIYIHCDVNPEQPILAQCYEELAGRPELEGSVEC